MTLYNNDPDKDDFPQSSDEYENDHGGGGDGEYDDDGGDWADNGDDWADGYDDYAHDIYLYAYSDAIQKYPLIRLFQRFAAWRWRRRNQWYDIRHRIKYRLSKRYREGNDQIPF